MMAKVNYTAHIYQVGTRTLPTEVHTRARIRSGNFSQGSRPRGMYTYRGILKPLLRGVFAAYCDVRYNKNRARVVGLPAEPTAAEFFSRFTFSTHYQNGEMAFDGR